jgi:hypothetical protein
MMEAVRTSETSADNHSTRQYNPEDSSEHHTRRRENLKSNIVEDIKLYQKKWLDHLERMDRSRLPKLAFQYQPRGLRDMGRARRRWRDQEHPEL